MREMKRALVALACCIEGGMALAKPEISWSVMHPPMSGTNDMARVAAKVEVVLDPCGHD